MTPHPKTYLYKRIVQAKIFIDEHYANSIDLDNIADEASFSKFHFIRLFKSIYKKSPHQYLTYVRIEKAKTLLKNNIPSSEVCDKVGFDSVSSFTGLFKRFVGLTPSTYQMQQAKRIAELEMTPLKFIPNCFAEKKGWTNNSNFQEVS